MRLHFHISKRVVTSAASAAVVIGAAGAFAAWTSGGSGFAGGAAASNAPLVITKAVPSTAMRPGDDGALALTVVNPNPQGVAVSLATFTNNVTIDGSAPGCAASNFSLIMVNRTLAQTIPSNTPTTIEVANAVHLDAQAPNECQGAKILVPVTIS